MTLSHHSMRLVALLAAATMLTPLAYLVGRHSSSSFPGSSVDVSAPSPVQPIPALGAVSAARYPAVHHKQASTPPAGTTTTGGSSGQTPTTQNPRPVTPTTTSHPSPPKPPGPTVHHGGSVSF